MEAAARERQARLAALRASKAAAGATGTEPEAPAATEGSRKRAHDGDVGDGADAPSSDGAAPARTAAADAEAEGKAITFRNYTPHADALKPLVAPKAAVATVEDEVKKFARSADELARAHDVDLMNLAPKRPNWDLKRDLSRKLARVDRKTKRAIAELIRERVLKDKDGGQLVATVAAQKELTAGDESD